MYYHGQIVEEKCLKLLSIQEQSLREEEKH